MISFKYDPESDSSYVKLTEGAIATSREVHPGVVLDLSDHGELIGIEILHVSKRGKTNVTDADS